MLVYSLTSSRESLINIEVLEMGYDSREKVEDFVNKTPNWKSPGPDLVQGFWLKRFTNLHERITLQLNECLRKGKVPTWMTKGRIVLIAKDPQKGSVPSNYRQLHASLCAGNC